MSSFVGKPTSANEAAQSQAGECIFAEINRNGVGGAAFKNPEAFSWGYYRGLNNYLYYFRGSLL